jgi:hypothetical protein
MKTTVTSAVIAAVVLLAGCSGGASVSSPTAADGPAGSAGSAGGGSGPSGVSAGGSAAPGGGNSPSTVPGTPSPGAPSAPPIVVPAKVGHCFNYKSIDHWVLDESTTVDCAKKHTAQTVYVGTLTDPAAISFDEAGRISDAAAKAGGVAKLPAADQAKWAGYTAALVPLSKACDVAIAKRTRSRQGAVVTSSLFTADFTGPTQAEWDKGARWVRCNVVAHLVPDDYDASQALLKIPTDLKSALDTMKFRNCWIPLEQGKAAKSVPCSSKTARRGAWLTISDVIPTGRSAYPGQKGALDVAKGKCLNLARSFATSGSPSVRWWSWHEKANGSTASGVSKGTWGTDKAHLGCAISNWQFKA